MKLTKIFVLAALSLVLFACSDKTSTTNTSSKPDKEADQIGYAIGYDIGSSFLKQFTDDSIDVNLDYVMQGIRDGLKADSNNKGLLTKEERDAVMQNLQTKMQAMQEKKQQAEREKYNKRAANAEADGKKFLEENAKKSGVVTEKNGLQYKVLTKGTGAIPKETDMIRFHIVGKFIDGETFQSTRDMANAPEVPLSQLQMKGLHEAFSKMSVGSKWEIYVPYELAYGTEENGVIPPKSAVVFEIELLDIVKPEANTNTPPQPNKSK